MAEKIEALRLQVSAAQFLLHSLQAQLHEAERAAGINQQSNGESTIGSALRQPESDITPEIGGNEGGLDTSLGVGEVGPTTGDEFPEDGIDIDAGLGDSGDEDAPHDPVDDDNTPMFDLPSLEVGTVYPTLEEVKKAAIAHAISQGWTCGVDKRDRTRLMLKCRSDPACPFFLRAEQYDTAARVCSYRPNHTCTFRPDQSHIPRAHTAQLRFMKEQLPNFLTVTTSTTAQEISEAIYQRFGTRVSLKQCRSLTTAPKRIRAPSMGTCSTCGAVGHNKKTCGRTEVP